ncbi:MAG TPA: AtpZ/AtpI family protein [Patescibacteria group bacterium]|nr:AtpZ/AtpI family protein [Patescibacteria group bacterium]
MSLTPEELDQKIKDARAKQRLDPDPTAPQPATPRDDSATGKAMRASTELLAALIVGGALGYGLDSWLGTKPLFMILLFFAGFAAGFLNIYRAQTGQDFRVGLGELNGSDNDAGTKPGEKER